MKKKLFSIMAIGAIALTSCKKEEVLDSNQLGEATINGNLFAHIDERNDVDADGQYVNRLTPENLEGVAVTVTVDTKEWDQSPQTSGYVYPKKTYSTVTDASGNYTLVIPCTDAGYAGGVEIEFGSKLVTYYEYSASGEEKSEQIEINDNTQTGVELRAGMVVDTRYEAGNWDPVSGTSAEYGSATYRVTYRADYDATMAGSNDTLTGSSLIGQTVSLKFQNGWAPGDLSSENIYTATIAVDVNDPTTAIAEFTIPTPAAGQGYTRVQLLTSDFQGVRVYDDGGTDANQNCIWNFASNVYNENSALYDGTIYTNSVFHQGYFSFNDN